MNSKKFVRIIYSFLAFPRGRSDFKTCCYSCKNGADSFAQWTPARLTRPTCTCLIDFNSFRVTHPVSCGSRLTWLSSVTLSKERERLLFCHLHLETDGIVLALPCYQFLPQGHGAPMMMTKQHQINKWPPSSRLGFSHFFLMGQSVILKNIPKHEPNSFKDDATY